MATHQCVWGLQWGLRWAGERGGGAVVVCASPPACADVGVRRQMGHILGRHRLMSYIARDEEVDKAIGNGAVAAVVVAALVAGGLLVGLARVIKDAIKFPDFVHTQKRDPKTNLKSPTMMWDFWSQAPESLHQVTMLFVRAEWVTASFQILELQSPLQREITQESELLSSIGMFTMEMERRRSSTTTQMY